HTPYRAGSPLPPLRGGLPSRPMGRILHALPFRPELSPNIDAFPFHRARFETVALTTNKISTMSRPFGVGGRTRRQTQPSLEEVRRLCVYDLGKAAGAPLGPFRREASVRVVVNGAEMVIGVVSEPRHLGGVQRYFLCACGRRVWHLYYVRAGERLVCRRC